MTDKRYINYYTPLIQEFVRNAELLPHPKIDGMPEPHLPLFGKNYFTSALRLVIIGQDTHGWGDLKMFIAAEKARPGCKLREGLEEFRDYSLFQRSKSTATPQRFLGFLMMFMAALHGQEDWSLMKEGKMREILDCTAWAECSAVEFYGSSAKDLGVPSEYWEAIRRAGELFNKFRHIVATLEPHAALILFRGLSLDSYFEGYRYEIVSEEGRLTHFRLPDVGIDVYHAPHPRSMNQIEGIGHFVNQIRELFYRHNTVPFPKFLAGWEEGKEVMEHLLKHAPSCVPDFDKYQFVAWVADELKKRESFMSVPTLIELINAQGYKTDYGEAFGGGRGSYRLVSGTYHRLMATNQPSRAQNVAVAFRRPDFEYAYDTE